MGYSAWLECFDEKCKAQYDLTEVIYNCRECGSLLQVVHDRDELIKTSANQWIRTFEERKRKNSWPYGSGVWKMKEWVMPRVENENIVSMFEGESNLFWAERLGKEIGVPDLWIKLCGKDWGRFFRNLFKTYIGPSGKEGESEFQKLGELALSLEELDLGRKKPPTISFHEAHLVGHK